MYLCTQNCNFYTDMILDKIDELLKEVQELSAKNAEEVEQLRLKYLSKKGEITALMNDFRNVAADQKKTVGMKINELKTLATERINQLREECETQETGEEALDLTRTPYPHPARYASSADDRHQRDHRYLLAHGFCPRRWS